ncbi:TPA: hypothetical protein ACIYHE_003666 [Escherichia coli]
MFTPCTRQGVTLVAPATEQSDAAQLTAASRASSGLRHISAV